MAGKKILFESRDPSGIFGDGLSRFIGPSAMTVSLSREFLLMAACSTWPPSDHRTDAIRAAAAEPLDWNLFERIVTRHRVVGLAYEGLRTAGVQVPALTVEDLGNRAAALVRAGLVSAAEAARLQSLFDKAALPVLFVKGPSLAMLAYGNLGLRESKDLDLFVPPESLASATALIESAGYRRYEPPPNILPSQMKLLLPFRRDFGYFHEESQLELELHWRLLSNPHLMADTTIISSSRVVPLKGTAGLRTLGEDDLFAYLCAHGAVHSWYQFKWLADVGALLASAPEGGAERLYRAAELRGAGAAAAQAILLCKRLLGTRVPGHLITLLRKHAAMEWLETTALKAMNNELEPGKLPLGTTRGSLSSFLLGRGWRYWLAELKGHLICQADVMTLALPKELHFLYPVLRLPLWLWRQVTRRYRLL